MNAREITRYENELMRAAGRMLGAVGDCDALNALIDGLRSGILRGTFNSQQGRFVHHMIAGIQDERHECTPAGRKILSEQRKQQSSAACERIF
jgi:hypothetical protein